MPNDLIKINTKKIMTARQQTRIIEHHFEIKRMRYFFRMSRNPFWKMEQIPNPTSQNLYVQYDDSLIPTKYIYVYFGSPLKKKFYYHKVPLFPIQDPII